MWMVTQDEAVEMYARMFLARHGRAACKLARETARSLEKDGDAAGCKAWTEVAEIIERHQQKPH